MDHVNVVERSSKMPRLSLAGRLSPPALSFAFSLVLPLVAGLVPAAAQATPDQPPQPALPAVSERIEVTATRVPEDVEPVPVAISIVTGDELAARGATDLGSALALVSGVAV